MCKVDIDSWPSYYFNGSYYIYWYDDLTPTGSLMNLQITVNHNEDENDLRTLGLDLYKLKETQVRYRLHQEYLNKYIVENIIPVGLQITNRPIVGRDNDHTRDFNPITYGILPFRQLRGGGLFGPDPENKVTVNRLI